MIIAMWRIFTKAGQPGWAAIIPFYNIYVLMKVVGRPGWWLILFLIPLVNFGSARYLGPAAAGRPAAVRQSAGSLRRPPQGGGPYPYGQQGPYAQPPQGPQQHGPYGQ